MKLMGVKVRKRERESERAGVNGIKSIFIALPLWSF
jgi:hypothetical protein